MNGSFCVGVALCGCDDDDVKVVKDAINAYDNADSIDIEQGIVRIVNTLDEMTSETIGFDLSDDEKLVVRINGCEKDFNVRYKQEDKRVLLEQMVLMISGDRALEADIGDILSLMENGCTFSWKSIEEDDLPRRGIEFFAKIRESSQKDMIDMYYQITGDVSLLSCSLLNDEIEKSEWINNAVFQVVNREGGDSLILSAFLSE